MSRATVLGLAMLLGIPPATLAQTSATERRHEEQVRAALDPAELAILKKERRLVTAYGIWINHLFSDFKDDDNDAGRKDVTNATYAIDTRGWVRFTLRPPLDGTSQREHSLYLRIKDKSTWRDPSDANGNFDHNGPHVDYLFLTSDWRPLLLQVGRRLYGVGQGLAYSDLGDGIELLATSSLASLMGLVARSLPHQDNLDLSVPNGKRSGRMFYGLEGRYLGIRDHGLYSFLLFEQDDADEDPLEADRDYKYNAQYYGGGVEGKVLANLRYVTEVVFETGHASRSASTDHSEIRAWAMDASVTYDAQLPWQPTLYGEYAFGSGDADRTNVTDTTNGNTSGRDTNFLYFGYLPTGYALSPRLSNLRMLKGGVALKPLEWLPWCKDLTVSTDLYWFWKDEPLGGVFDTDATEANREIGSEWDVTLTWPLLSDLRAALEYGRFSPGAAYPTATNDDTRYLSVSVTTTF